MDRWASGLLDLGFFFLCLSLVGMRVDRVLWVYLSVLSCTLDLVVGRHI